MYDSLTHFKRGILMINKNFVIFFAVCIPSTSLLCMEQQQRIKNLFIVTQIEEQRARTVSVPTQPRTCVQSPTKKPFETFQIGSEPSTLPYFEQAIEKAKLSGTLEHTTSLTDMKHQEPKKTDEKDPWQDSPMRFVEEFFEFLPSKPIEKAKKDSPSSQGTGNSDTEQGEEKDTIVTETAKMDDKYNFEQLKKDIAAIQYAAQQKRMHALKKQTDDE